MDFKDQIRQFGERVGNMKDNIQTEEATKNAFIMPFLQILGYDVFNPMEVVPEFICDIGTKKGEKIDYAIFRDGQPIVLVECKHWKQKLDIHDGQLLRYFHVSKAKFSILTNGLIFRFYTDLVEPNKMDEKPFLEFNIEEIKEGQIDRLKEFHKAYFDEGSIYNSASELKYTNELRHLIQQEFQEPRDEFVRYFVKQVYPSPVTAKVIEGFRPILKRTIANFVNDTLNDRLKSAIAKEDTSISEDESSQVGSMSAGPVGKEIETTEEELESFYIVRSILRTKLDVQRITHRDALSYFAIFLDDNNRRPICRLYLNGSKKYLGTFGSDKKENKAPIDTIDDIYKYSQELETVALSYVEDKSK